MTKRFLGGDRSSDLRSFGQGVRHRNACCGAFCYEVSKHGISCHREGGECMLRCWKEVSVCYVVRRRGVYVTLLEGGECMLRC